MSNEIRVLEIIQATGHPLWDEGMHHLRLDGKWLKISEMVIKATIEYYGICLKPEQVTNWKLKEDDKGVHVLLHACSSGFGRRPVRDWVLVLKRSEYDKVIWVGEPLKQFAMSADVAGMMGPDFKY